MGEMSLMPSSYRDSYDLDRCQIRNTELPYLLCLPTTTWEAINVTSLLPYQGTHRSILQRFLVEFLRRPCQAFSRELIRHLRTIGRWEDPDKQAKYQAALFFKTAPQPTSWTSDFSFRPVAQFERSITILCFRSILGSKLYFWETFKFLQLTDRLHSTARYRNYVQILFQSNEVGKTTPDFSGAGLCAYSARQL